MPVPAGLVETLRTIFGIETFRPRQQEAVDSLLSKNDTLVVMPTGSGKSLCYQLPAVMLDGTALVVSPLISLMKDQVDKLNALGIAAEAINSALGYDQIRKIYGDLERNTLKLLYVAPERLESRSFLELLTRCNISFIAIDEAHCISEWGHDFRRSYRRIPECFEYFSGSRPPIIALTATATPDVREDIIRELHLHRPTQIVTGFERPNIRYAVLRDAQKDVRVIDILHSISGSAIIYTASRAKSEKISLMLKQLGFVSEPYHGGMQTDLRSRIQSDFLEGKTNVIVATSAFGMGIDKPDVRAVVHYDIPATLEAYYQEAGRAGRDSNDALAILLYNPGDERSQEFLIGRKYPSEENIRSVYEFIYQSAQMPQGKIFSEPLFFSIAQVASKLGDERASVTRILDLLQELEIISSVKVDSGTGQLYIEPTRDRARAEEYLSRSRNSLQGQLFRYILNAPKNDGLQGVLSTDENLARILQADRTSVQKAIRLLEGLDLLTVKRNASFASDAEVVAVTVSQPMKRWEEIHLPLASMEEKLEHSLSKLQTMREYASGWECRSAFILRYFGERTGSWKCGVCDVCSNDAANSRAVNR
ncbi:MAG TPA: ATP-dependent DNA helicase RecQ [Candidatus Kapabacteria bacterium]|nr:ATP-dependent DNA helicase RecQ [Candidatus Kapabacteria bacterium]